MARVVALVPDLFFASKVKETLTSAGYEVALASDQSAAVKGATVADAVIIDLHADDLSIGELMRQLNGKPTLGFYSHVDENAKHAARLAGVDIVVPRSRMARDMPSLVGELVT